MQKRHSALTPAPPEPVATPLAPTPVAAKPALPKQTRIYAYVSEASHKELKVYAAQQSTAIDTIVKEAVNLYLADKNAGFQVA